MVEKKDVPMNTFTPATDAEYIYAEAIDGSQVKIKKSDLIGLIGAYCRKSALSNVNIDTFRLEIGTYGLISGCTTGGKLIPSGSALFMFSGGYTTEGLQVLCNYETGISIRTGFSTVSSFVWKEWHKLV